MSDLTADTLRCAFHPSVPTLLSCTRCDRPACPDCLVDAPVGKRCVACIAEQSASGTARERAARRSLTRPGWVFWALTGTFLGFCVLVASMPFPAGQAIPGGLRFASFALVVSGWVVSLCLHEWAHAYVAYRSGDHSVVGRGYLTLDPRKYTDPVFSVAIPVAFLVMGGIGLPGGAVWIDHGNIRSRRNRSLVSLAGPVVNVVFGVACIVPVAAGVFDSSPTLAVAIAYLGWLEFATATLNLLPVPGLDGYGIVEPYLPHAVRAFVNPYAHYAILILLVLMITTSFGTFVFEIADAATAALGVDPNVLVHDGRLIANVQLL